MRAWEQRALLETFAPSVDSSATPEPDPELIVSLIERFSPWPAYAYHPDGALSGANTALASLLSHAASNENLWDITAPETGPNIYDLVFHPKGLVNWMENPNEVIPETLRRLRIEAAQNLSLLPLLRRIEAYPSARTQSPNGKLPPPVLIERYSIGGETLSIVSVIAQLSCPGDQSLERLRIENFVPADAESEALLRRF